MTKTSEYLKSISFDISSPHQILSNRNNIEDIEIWGQTTSPAFKQYISHQRKPLEFIGVIDITFTPIWSIISEPFPVYTSNEDTLESLTNVMNHSNLLDDTLFENGLLLRSSTDLFILIFFERNQGINSVHSVLLNFNFNKIQYYINKEQTGPQIEDPLDTESYFIDGVALKRATPTLTSTPSSNAISRAPSLSRTASSLNLSQVPSSDMGLSLRSNSFISNNGTSEKIKIMTVREEFKRIIRDEILKEMAEASKSSQNDVSEICYRALNFKYKELRDWSEEVEVSVRQWVGVLLGVLGVQETTTPAKDEKQNN